MVDTFCFPPAPTWYSGHVLASCVMPSTGQVLLAYATRQEVVFVQHPDSGSASPYPRVTIFKAVHDKSKIAAIDVVVEAENANVALVVTTEDGLVRCYKLSVEDSFEDREGFIEHNEHRSGGREKSKVTAVCWSRTESRIALSGDEKGQVAIWDTRINSSRGLSFQKHTVNVIQSHPTITDLAGIGCKGGLAFTFSTSGTGKMLRKIRAHDEDIHGLSWCPSTSVKIFGDDNSEDEHDNDALFAVSSKDRTISVWSAFSGQKKASVSLLRPKTFNKSNNAWITCHWTSPAELLTSGSNGMLLKWNLSQLKKINAGFFSGDEKVEAVTSVHEEHAKVITNIKSEKGVIFSVGHDRSFVAFDMTENKLVYNLPAFTSWIYCLAENPIENSLLAIGAGDSQIRIWRTNSSKSMFDVTSVSNKLSGAKVTALAWHPTNEGQLAMATDEGRIGIVDALNKKSTPTFFPFKHGGQTYNLSWGPRVGNDPDSKANMALYSCGDNKIIMHIPNTEKANGSKSDLLWQNVEELITTANGGLERPAPSRSDLAFSPDFGLLALGSDDGSVEICEVPSLKIKTTLKAAQKLIQNLKWHPSESKWKSWLAVASNENAIHLFDLKNVSELPSIVTSPSKTLSGHLMRVTHLNWSPHNEDLLLSVSYDGTAQIWNIDSSTPVANYDGHSGRVLCGIFSQQDPDLVFTGGVDCTLQAWRISEQKKKIPSKKAMKKPKLKRNTPNDEQKPENVTADGEGQAKQTVPKDRVSADPTKVMEKMLFSSAIQDENVSIQDKDAFDECLSILEDEVEQESSKSHMAFYQRHERIGSLLTTEAEPLESKGHRNAALNLRLWHGDVAETIRKAAKAGQLNDWMINVAAGASRRLWEEACEAYALQLASNDDPIKAASYFLMLHKVVEAIDVLSKAKQFRCALALAKSRLPESDPIIKDLHVAWARHATSDGVFEIAAKNWVASGDTLAASNVISKRNGPDALRVAAMLAREGGDEAKATLLATQCVARCGENDSKCLQLVLKHFGKDLA